jgi:hypothetical protein
LPQLPVARAAGGAHKAKVTTNRREEPVQSLRIATGMGGLFVVTTILFVTQLVSGTAAFVS